MMGARVARHVRQDGQRPRRARIVAEDRDTQRAGHLRREDRRARRKREASAPTGRNVKKGSRQSSPPGYDIEAERARRPLMGTVIALGVLLAVFLAAFGLLVTCSRGSEFGAEVAGNATIEETPAFNWDYLTIDSHGFPAYIVDGKLISRFGVDVSDHNEQIDWETAAAQGVSFAFVRLGYRGMADGQLYYDDYYAYNLDEARAAGLDVGAYFFSQAVSVDEAIAEADLAIALLDGRSLQLPVVFDHEAPEGSSRAAGLSTEDLTAAAIAFCERMEAAGYKTMIYGNQYDIARFDMSQLGDRPLWYAEYVSQPTVNYAFSYWQFAAVEGAVEGIPGEVDLDIDLSGALP